MTRSHFPRLPAISKERLQYFCAAACEYSASNLHLVVQPRMVHNLQNGMYGTRFRIVRTIHQTFDARMHHRSGTHRARFNCNKQLTFTQSMVTDVCTGCTQCRDLGMGSRVLIDDVSVPSLANDSSCVDNRRSHGNFSQFESALRTTQGLFHPQLVRGIRSYSLRGLFKRSWLHGALQDCTEIGRVEVGWAIRGAQR